MPSGGGDFVGRADDLRELDAVLGRLAGGQGAVLVVTGEAGIGKTRLCEEAAARARRRGVDVAWAACWESASPAPLWPWSQLLRQVVESRPGVLAGLGSRAWVEAVMGLEAPDRAGDPESARAEVPGAVLDLLRAAGRRRPGLLVVDDLHWADAPSLRLLAAVAPAVPSMPLALAVTYRDDDAGPELAELRPALVGRATVFDLRGLDTGDVAELVRRATGAPPDASVVAALHERAGGNPLFTRELLRAGPGRAADLPPTVGAALGSRLGRLSGPCREVLTVAAVTGDEFALDVVALAAGKARPDVLAALDEASRARLVEEGSGPGRFRFSHALARAAAVESLGSAERARLHGRVGDALERLRAGGRAVDAAALAHHFTAAAASGDAARAVAASVEAAAEAGRRTAYEEAARLLRRAAELLDLDPAAADRTRLLLDLGEAEQAAGAAERARAAFVEAAELARSAGQPQLLARAALGVGGGGGFEVTLADDQQIDLLEEALGSLGDRDGALRSRLCGRLSIALTYRAAPDRRTALAAEAVDLARAAGDEQALGWALAARCDAASGPATLDDRLGAASEITAIGGRAGDRRLELLGRRLRAMALLERGDMAGFDAEVEAYTRVAGRLQQPLYLWYAALWRAMRLAMAGRFEAAEEAAQEAGRLGRRAGSANVELLVEVQRWCLLIEQGRSLEALELVEGLTANLVELTSFAVSRAVALAAAGRTEEARALVDEVAPRLAEVPIDSEWLPMVCQLALVADAAGPHRAAGWAYDGLVPYADQFAVEGIGAWCRGSVHEFAGLLAGALGREEDASRHLAAALEADERAGASVAAARVAARLSRRSPDAGPAGPAVFRREGEVWALAWGGTEVRVRDRKGLHDLARLLASPGVAVAAADLAGAGLVDGAGGEMLDARARRAYTARLRDIEAALDDADRRGDGAGSARLTAEREALVGQLSAAYGLGGRARRLGPSAAERARSTVTQRVRVALRHLEASHPALAAHLRASVRTGTFCVYDPAEPVGWRL